MNHSGTAILFRRQTREASPRPSFLPDASELYAIHRPLGEKEAPALFALDWMNGWGFLSPSIGSIQMSPPSPNATAFPSGVNENGSWAFTFDVRRSSGPDPSQAFQNRFGAFPFSA